jgi:hypothetical protein
VGPDALGADEFIPWDVARDADQQIWEAAVDAVLEADPNVTDEHLHMAVEDLIADGHIEDAWYDGDRWQFMVTSPGDAVEALRRCRDWRVALRRAKGFKPVRVTRLCVRSARGTTRRHRSVRRRGGVSRGSPGRSSADSDPELDAAAGAAS